MKESSAAVSDLVRKPMLRLMMRRGPTPGAIYELEDAEITIGRGSKNQIVIRDDEVSREHCRLIRQSGHYEVIDLNSSNGTFVNGQRVVGAWMLQPGSIIELGDSITLEYERLSYDFQEIASESLRSAHHHAEATAVQYRHSLLMTMGPSVGYTYPLRDVIITVGRDLSNDIVIHDPEISRYHLRLRRQKQGYCAEDMGSTNGTYLNDTPLEEIEPLESDDVLKLGSMVQLQYVAQQLDGDDGDDTEEASEGPSESPDPLRHRDETIRLALVDGTYVKTSRLGTGIAPGALTDHIFLAYAREDWESMVASLVLNMLDAGLKVWVDQYLMQSSDDWRVAVEQALTECRLAVLVLSPQSLENPYVKLAYGDFLDQQKPVVVMQYQNVKPLPDDLSRQRSIVYDTENPRKSFHKLIFEIMQHRH
jgi:pSer/pThr/pTyr-binding forkhead associated (FHA) protein